MTTQKLKIEVGKTYVTRCGDFAYVESIDIAKHFGTTEYAVNIVGRFTSGLLNGKPVKWDRSGNCYGSGAFDLVREDLPPWMQPNDGTDVIAALKLIRAFSPALLSVAGEATLKHAEKPPRISQDVWVNVYPGGNNMHPTKAQAEGRASSYIMRVAVPCRLEEIIDAS